MNKEEIEKALLGKYINGYKIVKVEQDPFMKDQLNLLTEVWETNWQGDKSLIVFRIINTSSNYEELKEISYVNLETALKLQQENKQLKEKINTYENPEDLTLMFMYCDEKAKDKIKGLNEKVDYLKNKCENKDKWCQLIADVGYDYDGYRQADSLMKLIDELVKYAIWSRDDYDYDAFQEEGNNE